MAWATEPSPNPASYPSPNPAALGNALSNLVSNYQQAQQGQQATQQNNLRLQQDQQLLDQSKAFAGGVPMNPDGTINWQSVATTRAEKGDVNALSSLAPIIQQQQNLQGANAPDPIIGGGGSPAPTGSDPLGVVVGAETGGKNEQQSPSTKDVNNNYGAGGGTPAEGYFQIIDPTWREYAPKAGVDVEKYPSAIDAPYAVQAAVAQQIPINQWGPKTVAALNSQFPGLNDRETLGQAESQYGGKGTQVASAGDSDAPAYASPDKPSIPPVSAAAGSSIPRENATNAVGAVGGAPQQSQGGPLAANNPAWGGLNASLPVGPPGAPAQSAAAPAPRAPAAPSQGSVASIASQAGLPPQVTANIAKAVGASPDAPLTPQQAQRAQTIVKNYKQRAQQQQQTAAGQGQPQGQPAQGGGPIVPQFPLPNGIKDPQQAILAIDQDIARLGRFGPAAGARIKVLEDMRDRIAHSSAPIEGRPGQMFLNPRTGQPIAQVPYPNMGSTLSPAALDTSAENYYQTGKLPPNIGRGMQGAGNINAIMERAAELHPDEPPESWAQRQQAFNAGSAGQRLLATRTASLELASNEASRLIPRVQAASKAVDRTKYPDLNKIIEAAETGTGDPNVIRLGIAAESLSATYARVLSPTGNPTVGDKENAHAILAKYWSDGQIDAGLDQMQQEIDSAKSSLNDTRTEMGASALKGGESAGRSAPATAGAPPAGHTEGGYRFKGGDPSKKENWEKVD
jgi:hypothetical protein